jgi:hypothetical protein
MKLSWIFGPSMEAHHLLYAYVTVWLIQGGYAAWIAWHWAHTGRALRRVLAVLQLLPHILPVYSWAE